MYYFYRKLFNGMGVGTKKVNPWVKRILITITVVALLGIGVIWYIFSEKFTDTREVPADYTVNALDLIHEFEKDEAAANKKYGEKIVVVNGRVSEVEAADTTVNIKMADTTSGSYVIFAFQQQHLADAKSLQEGDSVGIKGSCSGGAYSKILEMEFITFKRCALNK